MDINRFFGQKANAKQPTPRNPETPCPACARLYRYPWAWAITLPGAQVIDLRARCSRALRYGEPAERQAVADAIAARYGAERRAAA